MVSPILTTKAQVPIIDDITQINCGSWHSIAIKSNGDIWTWGRNDAGQLGLGNTSPQPVPVLLPGINSVSQVAIKNSVAIALKSNGTVWEWGDGGAIPNQVAGLVSIIGVGRGFYTKYAIQVSGNVLAWGNNFFGQLGDGTRVDRTTPGLVPNLTNITFIEAGLGHAIALKSDGTVWAWGNNVDGQLGLGHNSNFLGALPSQVLGINNIIQIKTGRDHNVALKSDGTVWAWGANSYGQLGDGSMTSSNMAQQVVGLTNIVSIGTALDASFAIDNNGNLWAWGRNTHGQLGLGNANPILTPTQESVIGPNVLAVAGGEFHSSIVKNNSEVCTAGSNFYSQLGTGSILQSSTTFICEIPDCDAATVLTSLPPNIPLNAATNPCDPGGLSSPCPGNKWQYCFEFENSGLSDHFAPAWGPIAARLMIDPNMDINSATVNYNPCGYSFVPNVFFNALDFYSPAGTNPVGTICEVCVELDVLSLPSPYYSTSAVYYADCPAGTYFQSKINTLEEADACSCDPNDIQVSPVGCGPDHLTSNETLLYTIRFQNVGTGPATDVVIRDTLDSDLDTATFELVYASHTISNIQITNNGVLIFSFNGINLPAEINDPAGSIGQVQYNIHPVSGIANYTPIQNSAAIYFDQNTPVITNEVLNTIITQPVYSNDAVCSPSFLGVPTSSAITTSFDLTCATAEAGEVHPGQGSGHNPCQSNDGWCWGEFPVTNTLWYVFIAPPSGEVCIEAGPGDTQLAVYLVSDCNLPSTFAEVGANDNGPVGLESQLCFGCNTSALIPGFPYFIQLSSAFGRSVIGNLTITEGAGGSGLTVDAGDCQTVYPGYSSMGCALLQATASGGTPPLTYSWSNGATASSIIVCPTINSTYTVTVSDACGAVISDQVAVEAVNVVCGQQGNKIQVCHLPPGNQTNERELCVALDAVDEHLAHGDHLGPCGAQPCHTPKTDPFTTHGKPTTSAIKVSAIPNPFQHSTHISYQLPNTGYLRVHLYNMMGQHLRILFADDVLGNESNSIKLDQEGMSGGVYLVRFEMDGMMMGGLKVVLVE